MTARESTATPVVAFDAHHIGSGQGGNETYSREVLKAWAGEERLPSLVPIIPRARVSMLDEATGWPGRVLPMPNAAVARWSVGFSGAARRLGAAALHTQYFRPARMTVPLVVTVHDVSYLRYPQWFPPGAARVFALAVAWAVRSARAIVTVTEAMAVDVANAYPDASSRIRTALSGAPRPLAAIDRQPATGDPWLLYVGNGGQRKNLDRLLQAFAVTTQRRAHVDLRLKLAGSCDQREVTRAASRYGVGDKVELLGRVGARELEHLYASATALVSVSLYEGYGLPVAEALARGVPVLASDIPAHREVAGDAAEFADPTDVASIADAIGRVVDGPVTNDRGRARATQLSWAATASALEHIYREVLA